LSLGRIERPEDWGARRSARINRRASRSLRPLVEPALVRSCAPLVALSFGEIAGGGGVRIFAARTREKVVVFDAGLDPQGRALDALLAHMNAARSDVTDVFLTHGHGDHIAAAPLLASARVHAGASDLELAATGKPAESFGAKFMRLAMGDLIPPVHVGDPLLGIVEVPLLGGDVVTSLPMPGHTPGSYAYLFRSILIVGDAMTWNGTALVQNPGMVEAHPVESRRAILDLEEPLRGRQIDRVCTGHAGCTREGRGRAELDALIARLRSPL
jgi:hydroxyacylglutathione hydrolase